MAHYKEKLHTINTFIFDFDGVLSNGKVWVLPDGDQIRATDVKDGYAIHYALKCGYNVCIISGGYSESMRKRYDLFPGMDIFLK
ncbi:MAG: 3-deoxy-D-manno-octulosonate 8-phosphate phosphatase, partial [Bacteroidales bacterium]|nr:3-deoxy-D-manno-octulosonate 8-phosphate phosphatase [Bacteroidales bacterium]